jgi:hypothetical protein
MPLFGPPNVEKLEAKGNVKGLIKALGYEKDADVREAAALALGQVGDAHAMEPLIAVLKDSTGSERWAAASALGEIGDARAVESLINTLGDKDGEVRRAAADALDKLGWQPGQSESGTAYWVAKRRWDKCAGIGAAAAEPLINALGGEEAVTGALQNGHTELAELLIDKGASADWTSLLEDESCLHHPTTVELLIDKGADVNAAKTALFTAVDKYLFDTVRLLIDKGADVNEGDGVNVPLTRAAADRPSSMVQILIEAGANVNARTRSGFTALMVAAGRGHTEVVQKLLEAGADVNAKANNGQTASRLAESRGYTKTANVIKKHSR